MCHTHGNDGGCAEGLRCGRPEMMMGEMGDNMMDMMEKKTMMRRGGGGERSSGSSRGRRGEDSEESDDDMGRRGHRDESDEESDDEDMVGQCISTELCDQGFECGAMRLVPALTAAALILAQL